MLDESTKTFDHTDVTFFPGESQENVIALKYERLVVAFFMVIIVGFMLFDVLDDWYEGISIYHIIPEFLIGVGGMGCSAYLFIRFAKQRNIALDKAREEVGKAKELAREWQARASSFRSGLTEAISKQLNDWNLSAAEQEVCFLILKGFSLQEIADLRSTSERTVRQQASNIYKKSQLSGRVQLAAFFLEDLLASPG